MQTARRKIGQIRNIIYVYNKNINSIQIIYIYIYISNIN
jgi:hypothetical protein